MEKGAPRIFELRQSGSGPDTVITVSPLLVCCCSWVCMSRPELLSRGPRMPVHAPAGLRATARSFSDQLRKRDSRQQFWRESYDTSEGRRSYRTWGLVVAQSRRVFRRMAPRSRFSLTSGVLLQHEALNTVVASIVTMSRQSCDYHQRLPLPKYPSEAGAHMLMCIPAAARHGDSGPGGARRGKSLRDHEARGCHA